MSERDAALPNEPAERPVEAPPAGVSVWVACGKVRCLAYRTHEGKWVGTFTGQELEGVTGWAAI